MMRYSLLRRTISSMLKEMALTPSTDMALATVESGMRGDVVFILYDPSQIDTADGTATGFDDIPSSAVLAYIERDVSGEIHAPVAVKGYGPFIYEVAMATSANGIFSDREGRTSSALRVWQRFMTRPDVVKTLLEKQLRANDDPEDPMNYRFTMKNASIDTARLTSNNDAVVKARGLIGDKRFEHRLWGVGHTFFRARMKAA